MSLNYKPKSKRQRLTSLLLGDITGPSPANNEAERRMMSDKMHTLQLMIEQQTRVVEELRSSLARSNSKKIKNKLDDALKNLQALEAQQTVSLKQSPERLAPSLPTSPSGTFSPLPPVAPPRSESMNSGLPPQLPPRNKIDSPGADAPAPPPRIPTSALPPAPPSNKYTHRHSSENLHPQGQSQYDTGSAVSRRGSQAAPPSPSPHHVRTRSSPVISDTLEMVKSIIPDLSRSGQKSPRYETPPGTPPPPYIMPELITWNNVSGGQPDIMTMDDDSDDEEVGDHEHGDNMFTLPPEGDHGPFNSLPNLMQHSAHLAVFLNYVISNSDPNPLLFYLITDAYKSGTIKEMRRWAYEIHSCFLVPRSPLEIPNLDESTIHHIDRFLSDENSDQLREDSLKKLFWKVISKTREILKLQLDDFRATRAAGLGNIFGPADAELKLCDDNTDKRMSVINDRLVPMLETMAEDLENATDKSSTLCASLATVLSKIFNTKDQKALNIIEKIPTFLSREKKRDKFFGNLKQKVKINGHNFQLKHYDQVNIVTCGKN